MKLLLALAVIEVIAILPSLGRRLEAWAQKHVYRKGHNGGRQIVTETIQDWKVERRLPNDAGAVITVVASGVTEAQARGIAAVQEDPENIYLVSPGGGEIAYQVRERPTVNPTYTW